MACAARRHPGVPVDRGDAVNGPYASSCSRSGCSRATASGVIQPPCPRTGVGPGLPRGDHMTRGRIIAIGPRRGGARLGDAAINAGPRPDGRVMVAPSRRLRSCKHHSGACIYEGNLDERSHTDGGAPRHHDGRTARWSRRRGDGIGCPEDWFGHHRHQQYVAYRAARVR